MTDEMPDLTFKGFMGSSVKEHFFELAMRFIKAEGVVMMPAEAFDDPLEAQFVEALIAAAYIQGHDDGCAEQMRTEGTA
jgi:hypothetical protein